MDKKYSRIKHIMGKYYYKGKYEMPISESREYKINQLLGIKNKKTYESFNGVSSTSLEHRERMEVFNYFYKEGRDDSYIQSEWFRTQLERKSQGSDYNKKPIRERKDNQNPLTNTINYGSGDGGHSAIRVPSKKHKNRWKNFLKLFPKFK